MAIIASAALASLLLAPAAARAEPTYGIGRGTETVTVTRAGLIAELERLGVPEGDSDVRAFLDEPTPILGLRSQDPANATSIRVEMQLKDGVMRPMLVAIYPITPPGDGSRHTFFPRFGDPPSYPRDAYIRHRLVGGETWRLTHMGPPFAPTPLPGGGSQASTGGGSGGDDSSDSPTVGRGPVAPRVDSYNFGLAGADEAEADRLNLTDFWGSRNPRSPEYFRLYRKTSGGRRIRIGTAWTNDNGQAYLNLHSGTFDPETGVEVHGSFIPFHGRNYRGSERALAHADGWHELNFGWVTTDEPGQATYRQAHLIPAGYTASGERLYRVRGLPVSEQATFTVETVSRGYFRVRRHADSVETHRAPDSEGLWESSRTVRVGPLSRGVSVTLATYQGREWAYDSDGNLLSRLPIQPGATFEVRTVGARRVYVMRLEGSGPYQNYHLALDGTIFRFVETAWDCLRQGTDQIRARHRFTHAPPGGPGNGPYSGGGMAGRGPGNGQGRGPGGAGGNSGGNSGGNGNPPSGGNPPNGGSPAPEPRSDPWDDWNDWLPPSPSSTPGARPKPNPKPPTPVPDPTKPSNPSNPMPENHPDGIPVPQLPPPPLQEEPFTGEVPLSLGQIGEALDQQADRWLPDKPPPGFDKEAQAQARELLRRADWAQQNNNLPAAQHYRERLERMMPGGPLPFERGQWNGTTPVRGPGGGVLPLPVAPPGQAFPRMPRLPRGVLPAPGMMPGPPGPS